MGQKLGDSGRCFNHLSLACSITLSQSIHICSFLCLIWSMEMQLFILFSNSFIITGQIERWLYSAHLPCTYCIYSTFTNNEERLEMVSKAFLRYQETADGNLLWITRSVTLISCSHSAFISVCLHED